MSNGDFLAYRLDWENGEMQLMEVGPTLQKLFDYTQISGPVPISPSVRALDYIVTKNPQVEPPYHFLLDVHFDRDTFVTNMHLSRDYRSVVNVSHERLKYVLGGLLTPRETEIATLLFEGHTIRYIAGSLHIAEGTVKRIIYNIYQKMGVGSQVELIRVIYVRLAEFYTIPCVECHCLDNRPPCCPR